ncbi:MAG: metallophosphoesterase family protein [Bacteroidota bacterium]
MTRIGLLSDTHSHLDEKVFSYFEGVDEIWHAGDVGSVEVIDRLADFKKVRGVYGNIDGAEIRRIWPLDQRFVCDGLDVWITHIGGYPGRYNKRVREQLATDPPGLFICGHSHILKVMPDRKHQLLHINPGAAGIHGFHKIKTLIRFAIHEGKVQDLEVIELGRRGALT